MKTLNLCKFYKKYKFFKIAFIFTSISLLLNKSWTNSIFPFSTARCNAVLLLQIYDKFHKKMNK